MFMTALRNWRNNCKDEEQQLPDTIKQKVKERMPRWEHDYNAAVLDDNFLVEEYLELGSFNYFS